MQSVQSAPGQEDNSYTLRPAWKYTLIGFKVLFVLLILTSVAVTGRIDVAKFVSRDAPILARTYAFLGNTFIAVAAKIIPFSYIINALVIKGIQSLKYAKLITDEENALNTAKTKLGKVKNYFTNFVTGSASKKEVIAILKLELDGEENNPQKQAELEYREFKERFDSSNVIYKVITALYYYPRTFSKYLFKSILGNKHVFNLFYEKSARNGPTASHPYSLQEQITKETKKLSIKTREVEAAIGRALASPEFIKLLTTKLGDSEEPALGAWFTTSSLGENHTVDTIKKAFYIQEAINLLKIAIDANDQRKVKKIIASYLDDTDDTKVDTNRLTATLLEIKVGSDDDKQKSIFCEIKNFIPSNLEYKPSNPLDEEKDKPKNKISIGYQIGDFFANFFTLSLTACCIYTAFGTGFAGIILSMGIPPLGAGILLGISLIGVIGMSWQPTVKFFHNVFALESHDQKLLKFLGKRKKHLSEKKDLMQKQEADLSKQKALVHRIEEKIEAEAKIEETTTKAAAAEAARSEAAARTEEVAKRTQHYMSLIIILLELQAFMELPEDRKKTITDAILSIPRALALGNELPESLQNLSEANLSTLCDPDTTPSSFVAAATAAKLSSVNPPLTASPTTVAPDSTPSLGGVTA